MATDVHTHPEEASMTSLMRGIINDLGDLIRQEVKFARTEIKADLRKTRNASAFLACGAGVALLGIVLFALMLVHLIHWLSLPAGTVTAGIPLWGCYGIVSAVFLLIGGVASWMGLEKFKSFNPMPDETAQTVKENVQWIANSK